MSMRVRCSLTNCLSYKATGSPNDAYCDCSHPDKRHYNEHVGACPLYRVDWTKTSSQVNNLREKFNIGSVYHKHRDVAPKK